MSKSTIIKYKTTPREVDFLGVLFYSLIYARILKRKSFSHICLIEVLNEEIWRTI